MKPEATNVSKSARAEEKTQKHMVSGMAHMPSGEKMRCKILDAEAAVDKEWDSLKKTTKAEASRESNPSQKVVQPAKNVRKIRSFRIRHELHHVKHTELAKHSPKIQGQTCVLV